MMARNRCGFARKNKHGATHPNRDPQQNGHRTPQQIVQHMQTPLVLWGWSPGDGRSPIPTPQHEFLAKVQEWVEKGAACPVEETATIIPDLWLSIYSDPFP